MVTQPSGSLLCCFTTLSREVFLNIQPKIPLAQLEAISFCPIAPSLDVTPTAKCVKCTAAILAVDPAGIRSSSGCSQLPHLLQGANKAGEAFHPADPTPKGDNAGPPCSPKAILFPVTTPGKQNGSSASPGPVRLHPSSQS